jgi:hypothetical protein
MVFPTLAATARGGTNAKLCIKNIKTEVANFSIGKTRTPAGEQWVQTPPLGLRGHKTARIAVGAVNNPLGTVHHSQRRG